MVSLFPSAFDVGRSRFGLPSHPQTGGRRHIARALGVVYINDDGSVAEEETTPENPVPAPVP